VAVALAKPTRLGLLKGPGVFSTHRGVKGFADAVEYPEREVLAAERTGTSVSRELRRRCFEEEAKVRIEALSMARQGPDPMYTRRASSTKCDGGLLSML
jgi:hypothetical protein